MCFSKEASLISLYLGLINSFIFIYFSKKNVKSINLKVALIFGFVSLMQGIEYLIWSDLQCTNGNNKLAGIIGPILNYLQPFIIFMILGIFKYPLINIINIIYLIYFFIIIIFIFFQIVNVHIKMRKLI